MPDHVHFFAAAAAEAKSLSTFMRDWKRWTSGQVSHSLAVEGTIWQREFFDHVLRTQKSYEEKWHYVRENPVRAGLVTCANDWPHAGECEPLGFR